MEKVPAEMMREFVRSQKFTSTDEVMTAMKNMFKDILQEVMECEGAVKRYAQIYLQTLAE